MYAELTVDELLEESRNVRNFVVASGFSGQELIDLSERIKAQNKSIENSYIVDAADQRNYPSRISIRKNPRFIIKGGKVFSETDGLIFPQSEPIILIIDNFYKLNEDDQKYYKGGICRKEDHDYYPHLYLHPKSIVIIGIGVEDKTPNFSYKFQVRKIVN